MPTPPSLHHVLGSVVLILSASLLGGCESVMLSILSVGAGTGVAYQREGIVYRTFSEPLPKVKTAIQSALARMDIQMVSNYNTVSGETIAARAADRLIDIDLEAVTGATTRLRVIVRRSNLLELDPATATEIIAQTGKALAPPVEIPIGSFSDPPSPLPLPPK